MKQVHQIDGEFWAYVGQTLVGIYTLESRAWEALGRW